MTTDQAGPVSRPLCRSLTTAMKPWYVWVRLYRPVSRSMKASAA